MIIAFMGNDGSGKTTIAWQIHKFLTSLGFENINMNMNMPFLDFFSSLLEGKK
jgi:thymidylate kinase